MSGDVGCFEGHELEQAIQFGSHAFRRICLLTTRVSIPNFTSIRRTSELWLMEDSREERVVFPQVTWLLKIIATSTRADDVMSGRIRDGMRAPICR